MFTCHVVCIGNSMIHFCSDIWHKYHEWYIKIVIRNFTSRWGSEIWDNFEILRLVFMPNITSKSCLYFFFSTSRKRFVIFTCKYLKLSRNTTAQSQSNCRNFSRIIINKFITLPVYWKTRISPCHVSFHLHIHLHIHRRLVAKRDQTHGVHISRFYVLHMYQCTCEYLLHLHCLCLSFQKKSCWEMLWILLTFVFFSLNRVFCSPERHRML